MKHYLEKILGPFSEPEIRPDGSKRYLPGDTVTITMEAKTDIKWDKDEWENSEACKRVNKWCKREIFWCYINMTFAVIGLISVPFIWYFVNR